MADPEQSNADQLAFWNGPGGHTWVARQGHTDITLTAVSEALLVLAAPRAGERVLDVGCGCGASTLDFARAVGPGGHVAALDISGPMRAEGRARGAGGAVRGLRPRRRNSGAIVPRSLPWSFRRAERQTRSPKRPRQQPPRRLSLKIPSDREIRPAPNAPDETALSRWPRS